MHQAADIRTAEVAKIVENTQRDLNIALMNELAMICDRLGLRTGEVIRTASTKWNFASYEPGLVGGHCIGVDPYYLTFAAEQAGHRARVILAGRQVNAVDGNICRRACYLHPQQWWAARWTGEGVDIGTHIQGEYTGYT